MSFLKFSLCILVLAVSACANEMPELKSPCVGTEDSPCAKRSPNNQQNIV